MMVLPDLQMTKPPVFLYHQKETENVELSNASRDNWFQLYNIFHVCLICQMELEMKST